MTRGDQRERDRLKNLKKNQEKSKGKRNDGVSVTKRKENDAEIMREKQKKAMEAKSAASATKAK
ncbi:uncharacterized protein VTP21DRAFT_7014 [Calcarisporiella thermophila]|uniref:uncharacterized protein n=1 Tax=Calcarisporiella thermophila TaxID=911321 RepID=UPI003743FFF2